MGTHQYKGVKKLFLRYWIAYGGLRAIITSPYFHASILITFISSGTWMSEVWAETPISVLPNIIGFSLGGYAIWLALGDDKFRAAISGKSSTGEDSPFIKVNATFVHFIALQILALIVALIAKSKPIDNSPLSLQSFLLNAAPWLNSFSNTIGSVGSFIGYMLFIYAILSALAAVMAIFKIAGWLDMHHVNQQKKAQEKKDAEATHPDEQTQ